MTLYDTELWNALDSAMAGLKGSYHYDHETQTEYNFPAKNRKQFEESYSYCYQIVHSFMHLEATFKEIGLIIAQIQHSQDFAQQHKEFSTDVILSFCYKNWIIRVNMIAEQILMLVNVVYRLNIPEKLLALKILQHYNIKGHSSLYPALESFLNFLQQRILANVDFKSVKKTRNNIVHRGMLKHTSIEKLTSHLFQYKFGMLENVDSEDIYLKEGQTSEQIKAEILDFSDQFLKRLDPVYSQFADEFLKQFNLIMSKEGNPK